MTNICRMPMPPPSSRAAPGQPTALPDTDRRKLEQHLRHCGTGRQPASPFLAHVLRRKIAVARPLPEEQADGIVTGGTLVRYAILDGPEDGSSDARAMGPEQSGLLVHRARTGAPAGAASGVIPVTSLLGATLIGMRTGQRAPLLCEDGTIMSVVVLGVDAPA